MCICAAEANLLFGRGMLAGIDRREQKKVAATVEVRLLRVKGWTAALLVYELHEQKKVAAAVEVRSLAWQC